MSRFTVLCCVWRAAQTRGLEAGHVATEAMQA